MPMTVQVTSKQLLIYLCVSRGPFLRAYQNFSRKIPHGYTYRVMKSHLQL